MALADTFDTTVKEIVDKILRPEDDRRVVTRAAEHFVLEQVAALHLKYGTTRFATVLQKV